MAEMRTFKARRGDEPPTPFRLTYDVREMEKYNAGTDEDPDWQERETDVWRTEERIFHAKPRVSAGVALAVNADPADPAGPARQARAIRRLIRQAVVEWEQFTDLLDDDQAAVDQDELGEIVNFLLGHAGGRPTGPS